MKILFLHGWQSVPGGVKPTYLKDHGHEVINPALPDDDFDKAVRIAQTEYDEKQPDVIVGSSRGGAVAMNINSQDTPLALLCPAWKKWGSVKTVKKNTTILHSRADDVIPFGDSEELIANSGLPSSALIEVGSDHRLADSEPLKKMLEGCNRMVDNSLLSVLQNLSESEIRWAEVEVALGNFQALLSPNVGKLTLQRNTDIEDWKTQKGVYLLFDGQDQLIYVGSTLDRFGNRIKNHQMYFEWHSMDFVVFDEGFSFMALALESYLIQEFLPAMNKRKK